jgi:protein involved in polysaccharide export with SLBB domain
LRNSILLALLVAAMCTGCQSAGPGAPGASDQTQSADNAYRLGAGDKVRVITFGEPDLTGEFTVSGSGQLSFPLIGQIKADGATISEVSEAISAALASGYLQNPKVSVEILNYRPFYILGEVNRPGEYPYTSGLTVTNAAATAGGFTYRANTHRMFIRGQHDVHEHVEPLTGDSMVKPGDTIRIPERYF